MRTMKKLMCGLLSLVTVLSLAGCGQQSGGGTEAEVIVIEPSSVVTPVSEQTPAPTPLPTVAPTPAPTTAPTAAPSPIPTTAPTIAPTQAPAPSSSVPLPNDYPVVKKDPTDETVSAGGSCYFVANYENAIWAEWHFVSPDGKRDLDYSQAAKEFPTLEIVDGYASTMRLKNIPESLNNWKVYCRFSNNSGAVVTKKAQITVTPAEKVAPKVTKDPTGETVSVGGSCYFVAKYENAIWAEWHFVSPDGKRDLDYAQAAKEFPTLEIEKGFASTMQLKNIPAELNGWKVYCRFSNNSGSTKTATALITVNEAKDPDSDDDYSAIYAGTYVEKVAKRAFIIISGGPDIFSVTVTWPNGAAERSTWVFSGSFNGRAVLKYTNCTKTTSTYDNAGNESSVIEYKNGSGYIQMTDTGLLWVDTESGDTEGTEFFKQ